MLSLGPVSCCIIHFRTSFSCFVHIWHWNILKCRGVCDRLEISLDFKISWYKTIPDNFRSSFRMLVRWYEELVLGWVWFSFLPNMILFGLFKAYCYRGLRVCSKATSQTSSSHFLFKKMSFSPGNPSNTSYLCSVFPNCAGMSCYFLLLQFLWALHRLTLMWTCWVIHFQHIWPVSSVFSTCE